MFQLLVAGLTVGSGYALVALGIHIILRATRIVNFAQGEFTIVGGLLALTFVQLLHWNTWFALVGATLAGFVLGLAFERVVLRPAARSGEIPLTIATLGTVSILLYGHALIPGWGSLPQPLPAFTGEASDAITAGGVSIQIQSLWVLALLFAALAVLYVFFERTYYGKAIRAAANNPAGAKLVGIDVTSTRAVSVGLAIALAAYGGTIIGPITLVGGAGGVAIAIKGFVGAIVGGLESPLGCVLGGLFVGVFEKLIQGVPGISYGIADPMVYSLLLIGLLLRPQGIFGASGAVRDPIARLRADTRTLPVLALIVVVFGIVAAGNPTFAQAGTYAAIFAIAAIGLSLLLGNVNQISLGAAGFFGIGAYAVASLTTTWNLPAWLSWPLAALIGIAAATLVGLALGFIALRFRGHYLAMATLTFGLICVGVFHETKFFNGAVGIEDIPYPRFGALTISGYPAYWFAWALALAVALLTLNLLRGRSGRAFEAIRNDELAAEALGVPTRRYKILAFAYAGALAGLGGAVYAAFLGVVVPDAVGVPLSISLLLMVVLGGSGGVSGALIGAALIGFLDITGHQFENAREVAYGILVILIVIAAPGGAFGLVRARFKPPKLAPRAAASAAIAERTIATPPAAETALAVAHVTKRFGGLVAVNDVSFALTRGTLTSLIGPNGAGKTTLFNAIGGIGRLTEGRISIAGRDVTGWQPHRVAGLGVGRTFQNARLFGEMTVLENVVAGAFRTERSSFGSDLFALPAARRSEREATDRARDTLVRLGLEPLAATYAKDLAFGDRRRVELARATASDPWLLLVDEPAAGLNAGERAALTADLLALRDAGMTLLLIEHDMRLVMAISERVMVLKFGTMIADGPPAAVRNDPAVVAAYLGTAS